MEKKLADLFYDCQWQDFSSVKLGETPLQRATHLFGCVAHVIKLSQVRIKSLGSIEESDTKKPLSTMMVESPTLSATPNPIGMLFVTSPPDSTTINVKTILKMVHGLCCMLVQFSPQHRKWSPNVVLFAQPKLHAKVFQVLTFMSRPNGTPLS
ncbi:uncharacterized protein VP01_5890g1 [Puccinia sorghi]|uniref:Uncharacterized protein n=1 Tax=Puccinia sorghi TaxID=27349 RepID=A0A0L6UHX0_9BASI|nr:uncharacterized protein VP01_5890g1 [Puccinia sorghi]